MKTSIRLLAVATSALALGACSSIGNKSADEMVRYAVQHNLTRDNQYNFEGKMFVQEVEMPEPQADLVAVAAADEAEDTAEAAGAAAAAAAEAAKYSDDDVIAAAAAAAEAAEDPELVEA